MSPTLLSIVSLYLVFFALATLCLLLILSTLPSQFLLALLSALSLLFVLFVLFASVLDTVNRRFARAAIVRLIACFSVVGAAVTVTPAVHAQSLYVASPNGSPVPSFDSACADAPSRTHVTSNAPTDPSPRSGVAPESSALLLLAFGYACMTPIALALAARWRRAAANE